MPDFLYTERPGTSPSPMREALRILAGPADWRSCPQAGGFYYSNGGWRRIPTEGGSYHADL